MAVYEGVLEQMSGGGEVAPDGTNVWVNESGRVSRSGVDRRIRRAFLEIGGKHVKNVVLSPYHDQLLVDSVGEEVAISAFGRRMKQVIAIRTRRGRDRPHFLRVLGSMVKDIVIYWVFALIVSLFLLGARAAFPQWEDALFAVGSALLILIMVWPFVQYFRIFRAWAALKKRTPIHPSPIP
jgi:hypothetical protein